ncbi:MAG TPA: nuclear transport factor 2 family protein [Mucilaginibacter sp.]
MIKKTLLISFFCFCASGSFALKGNVNGCYRTNILRKNALMPADTVPSAEVMQVVKTAINAINNFNIQAVADLYTPNAVIADDEPPYSWNGQTAGIQWINAIEKTCKDNHITKFRGSIEAATDYQQTTDNVYVVVPVTFTGQERGIGDISVRGAFTFVLRLVNDKWMIKSQAWMPEKGMQ